VTAGAVELEEAAPNISVENGKVGTGKTFWFLPVLARSSFQVNPERMTITLRLRQLQLMAGER
jgi:hypothetical protein